jgi:hypothetical protein
MGVFMEVFCLFPSFSFGDCPYYFPQPPRRKIRLCSNPKDMQCGASRANQP